MLSAYVTFILLLVHSSSGYYEPCPCYKPALFSPYVPEELEHYLYSLVDFRFTKNLPKRLFRRPLPDFSELADKLENPEKYARILYSLRERRRQPDTIDEWAEDLSKEIQKFLNKYVLDFDSRHNIFDFHKVNLDHHRAPTSAQFIGDYTQYFMKWFAQSFKFAANNGAPPLHKSIRDLLFCVGEFPAAGPLELHTDLSLKIWKEYVDIVSNFLAKADKTNDYVDYLELVNTTQLVPMVDYIFSDRFAPEMNERMRSTLEPFFNDHRDEILTAVASISKLAAIRMEPNVQHYIDIKVRQLIKVLREDSPMTKLLSFRGIDLSAKLIDFIEVLREFAADPSPELLDNLAEYAWSWERPLLSKYHQLTDVPPCVDGEPETKLELFGIRFGYAETVLTLLLRYAALYFDII